MTYRSTCDKYASDSEDNDEHDNPDAEDNFDEEDEHGVEEAAEVLACAPQIWSASSASACRG